MFNVYSPDSSFNGEYAGYKFNKGVCTTELDENLKLWFKMLGFKVEKAKEPIKKVTVVVDKPNTEENKAKEETEEK
jgi:hypothetical protein